MFSHKGPVIDEQRKLALIAKFQKTPTFFTAQFEKEVAPEEKLTTVEKEAFQIIKLSPYEILWNWLDNPMSAGMKYKESVLAFGKNLHSKLLENKALKQYQFAMIGNPKLIKPGKNGLRASETARLSKLFDKFPALFTFFENALMPDSIITEAALAFHNATQKPNIVIKPPLSEEERLKIRNKANQSLFKTTAPSYARKLLVDFHQEIWSKTGPNPKHYKGVQNWDTWSDLSDAEPFSLRAFFAKSPPKPVPSLIKKARELFPENTKLDEWDDTKIAAFINILNNGIFSLLAIRFRMMERYIVMCSFYEYYQNKFSDIAPMLLAEVKSTVEKHEEKISDDGKQLLMDFHREIWTSSKLLQKSYQSRTLRDILTFKSELTVVPRLIQKAREILPKDSNISEYKEEQIKYAIETIHQQLLSEPSISMNRINIMSMPTVNDFYERYEKTFSQMAQLSPAEIPEASREKLSNA